MLRAGLADGTLDAIATDHAPHPPESKEQEWAGAPNGMLGLETALAVTVTELVEPGVLTWSQAVAALSTAPARSSRDLADHGGPVASRCASANLVLIDPTGRWQVDGARAAVAQPQHPLRRGGPCRGGSCARCCAGRDTFADGEVTMMDGGGS